MKFADHPRLINDKKVFEILLKNDNSIENYTFQNLDLSTIKIKWSKFKLNTITFMGCILNEKDQILLLEARAVILPYYNEQPYNPYRSNLYTWQELETKGNENTTLDFQIYNHFYKTRFNPNINESLWQRIHDHAIDNALRTLIEPDDIGNYAKKIIGFMGGHGTHRNDEFYLKTAYAAKSMCEKGYFVASGGGPGIMEATNLGAYFGGRSTKELDNAIKILSKAPHYADLGYSNAALEVLGKYPNGQESLAIPTWFYGHEPSNLFASHIAKYFSNSIREDTLLAICVHGIIYAPGSAGTTQEIFMDAAQNHYGTFGYLSPMVFLGTDRYEINTFIFPTLKQLSKGQDYQKLLFLTNEPDEAVRFIEQNPPLKA